MTVFHAGPAGQADPELAGLLREVAARAAEHNDMRQPAKVVGGISHALDPASGVQLGSAEVTGLGYHARLAVGDVLAGGLRQAQEDGHPAADRLAGLCGRWQEFTTGAEAVA